MDDLPVAPHANTLLAQIERLVRSADLPIERLQLMIELYNAERARQERAQFAHAMSGLQSEVYQIYA